MKVQRKDGVPMGFILNSRNTGPLILHLAPVCGISITTPVGELWVVELKDVDLR
jgi:hypothetical protein